MSTTNTVFPEGRVHWFYRCFNWLCGKPLKFDSIEDKYYTVICNYFVYTTDGKFFYGYYTPEASEDLDPFSAVPPDFLFCCQCCCYLCCKCYRKKYNREARREADLFFGKSKDDNEDDDNSEDDSEDEGC
jgi:hypothetical protein